MLDTRDKVCIEQIQLKCRIGVLPWEKQVRQTVLLDIEYACEADRISVEDDLALAVDYAEVVGYAVQFVQEQSCQLLETLADRLAHALKTRFCLTWVKLRLKKVGLIPEAASVSVSVIR